MAESSSFGFWGITSEEILKTQFPLHRACRDGEVETLSLLLVEAQHGIYVEDSFYGWTPAHWAAYFGKLGCLRKLLQQTRVGVDCNIVTSRFCQAPAHLAAFGGHPHCLQWLLQSNAQADQQDYLGETASHKAARTGSLECATLLAAHGARLYICNKSGHSPAQLAANCGFEECARYLEAACKRQQNEPRGVYQNQTVSGPLQTSPHDITTVNTVTACGDGLHVNGAAGVHSQSNGASEECAMEEEAGNHDSTCGDGTASHHVNPAHISSSALAGGGDADITLHSGVSASQLTVGGRKRCREDAEESNFKRMRTHECWISCCGAMDLFVRHHPQLLQQAPSFEVLHHLKPSISSSPPSQTLTLSDSVLQPALQIDNAMDSSSTDSDGESFPFQDILALPVEPTTRMPDAVPSQFDNQYWHFVV